MQRITLWPIGMALVLSVAIAGACSAQSSTLIVSIDQTGPAWADSRLYDKLAERLTRDQKVRIKEDAAMVRGTKGQSVDRFDLDRLLGQGRAQGADYLLYIRISSERFDRRKTFSVPLVFHKWEVIGVIEGEWRLVDVTHERQVKAAPIKIEMNGKRVLQATMDDNIDDPDLNMSSSAKLEFFGQLEDLLAEQLSGSLQGQIGKQEREYVTRPINKK